MVATFGSSVVLRNEEKRYLVQLRVDQVGQNEILVEVVQATYTFERFNFDGNDKIIVADGNNAPTVFNSSFTATDVSESSVSGAKFVGAFKDHMFYAGKSSTPQEVVFSQPFDEDAFSSGSGAGSHQS